MKAVDRNGILAGVAIGIPLTMAKNTNAPASYHVGYVVGVVLFCWVIARLIGSRTKRS